MFLESLDNDDNIDPKLIEMKNDLLKGFEQIFKTEEMVRSFTKDQIVEFVEEITRPTFERLVDAIFSIDGFSEKIGEENARIISMKLNGFLDEAKRIMIEDDFRKGSNYFLDNYISVVNNINKVTEETIKKTETEEEIDYSEMTTKELRNEIDIALDNRDFDKVKEISKYIKESDTISIDVDMDNLIDGISNDITKALSIVTDFIKNLI